MRAIQVTNARSTASPEVGVIYPRALERAELDPTNKQTEQTVEEEDKEELEDLSVPSTSIDQFFSSEWYM
jgi:hypothetical protein